LGNRKLTYDEKIIIRISALLPCLASAAAVLIFATSGCATRQPDSSPPKKTMPEPSLVKLANPLQGMDSKRSFSHIV